MRVLLVIVTQVQAFLPNFSKKRFACPSRISLSGSSDANLSLKSVNGTSH